MSGQSPETDAIEPDECGSCTPGVDDVSDTPACPESKRPCGHHCNHVWTHDECHWCGETWSGDLDEISTPSAWCLCGVVDDLSDGTCGNCGLRIMTGADEEADHG